MYIFCNCLVVLIQWLQCCCYSFIVFLVFVAIFTHTYAGVYELIYAYIYIAIYTNIYLNICAK